MVERNDIPKLNSLFSRYQTYQDALSLFDNNPVITAFTLVTPGGEDEDPARQVTVDAEGIASPPQMLTAIKDQIEVRIKQINEQLSELGVAEASATPAAAPRAAPHKPEPPKHEPHKPPPRNTRR